MPGLRQLDNSSSVACVRTAPDVGFQLANFSSVFGFIGLQRARRILAVAIEALWPKTATLIEDTAIVARPALRAFIRMALTRAGLDATPERRERYQEDEPARS